MWYPPDQACPRCQIPRTARVSRRHQVCFNCRLVWDPASPPEPSATAQPPMEMLFTADEIERLSIYRAAIKAGFYTDDLTLETATV